jgi:hypothetical protein
MSPSEVDGEFRVMEIVDDDIDSQSQELQDIGMVLDFLLAELKSNNNFEFIQALMQLFLEVICVCDSGILLCWLYAKNKCECGASNSEGEPRECQLT